MTADVPALAVLQAGCAAVYLVLAALILMRARLSRTGLALAGACLVTAAWAAAVAVDWRTPANGIPGVLELARSVAWYGFVFHLYRRSVAHRSQLSRAFATTGLVAILVLCVAPLAGYLGSGDQPPSLWSMAIIARLGLAICNILLLENLYFNTPAEYRWHVNLICIGLGGLFVFDLFLYADAILFRGLSLPLLEGRACVTAVVAPLLAVAAARNRRWAIDIHVSRSVVFHSATLVASGVFLIALAAAGEVLRRLGSDWGTLAEVTILFSGVLAIGVLITSGSARSRLSRGFVNHFFSHRYDYRREWMRCISILSSPEQHVALQTRVIRAVAEVVDSPGGVLFVRDANDTTFQWAGSWNMPAATAPVSADDEFIALFRDGNWIVRLEPACPVPACFADLPRIWLAVPLSHVGRLTGFVLVPPPRAPFKLDEEVFDLLRIVGREVASFVAEQRSEQVLNQTRELQEYNKRFAFVVHDIKNVSSQLSLLLANAERHASNPEFQKDMLSTVRSSVDKITATLTRLRTSDGDGPQGFLAPAERIAAIAATYRRTRGEPIALEQDGHTGRVTMDPASFDAVVSHLLDNAIEASPKGRPVSISVQHERLRVVIDVVDAGPGMRPEFVRDELFRPFASTKATGHGIGAYQARELLRQAGGDLIVISRPGEGTTMRLLLPAAGAPVGAAAALRA